MSITEHQIELIQSSFEKVVPIADTAADIFYNKLFEIDPSLKTMFPDDMAEQKKKLMTALTLVVRGLKNLDGVVPVLQKLAVGHLEYGVKSEHYTMVGNALLRTLHEGLGEAFTPEVKEAWVVGYKLIADTMKSAAYN